MLVRHFKTQDAVALYELFYQTVHQVNAKVYTQDTIRRMGALTSDLQKWPSSLAPNFTLVV